MRRRDFMALVGGSMVFRGSNYQLTRGDINFANPFRLEPVLNIEASTTISQYQVTIDFTGPASRLQLNYRSDPPLPDSEIVALLALGNTGESAGLMSEGRLFPIDHEARPVRRLPGPGRASILKTRRSTECVSKAGCR